MAAGKMTTEGNPIEMLESVLLSVIDDDSFTLPTQQFKLCLEIASSLLESFCHRCSPNSQTHSNWPVGQLNNFICKANRWGSYMLNEERLWSAYHQLSISSTFQQVWKRFLSAEQLPNEPLLYQHFTDKALELLLKTKLPTADLL